MDGLPEHIILVAGMHRSGTSYLAHALGLCGADCGNRSQWEGADNPRGFWEDRMFVALNEHLLRAVGATWHAPKTVRADLEPPEGGLRKLLSAFEGRTILFKDPRLCWTYPVWANFFEDVPRISLVASLRHPAAVAASLNERDGMFRHQADSLYAEAYQNLLEWGAAFVAFPSRANLEAVVRELDLVWPENADTAFDPSALHWGEEAPAGDDRCIDLYQQCLSQAEESIPA